MSDTQQYLDDISKVPEKEDSKRCSTMLEEICEQRHKQRRRVFWLAYLSVVVLVFLIVTLLIVYLFFHENYFDSYFVNTVFVSILAYSFGVLKIITRSLWDDKNYIKALQNDHVKHHEEK